MNALFTQVDGPRLIQWNSKRQAIEAQADQYRIVILVLPGFSQLSLSSFVDPLRLANSVSCRSFFKWMVASLDGEPVECASGLGVSVGSDFSGVGQAIQAGSYPDMVIVCAGERVEKQASAPLFNLLRLCRRHRVSITALGTATWLLAEIGMLDDAACTIHWDKRAALCETFGRLRVTDQLFVRDVHIVTCAGEFACFDLVMQLISEYLGREAAISVCRHANAGYWRSDDDRQWTINAEETGICKPLAEVIRIMDDHIEDPLPLRDIARCVGRSQRQIERLFARSLSASPMRYYLHLRLSRAKRLIEQTELPVVEIAVACGFASASHFSKCFRQVYGLNPTACRT
ncbi:GlxA family transcriptional regulator [Mesorhizobium sp. M1340]|uniref:GlxA family transcriptional regulator n=1 Tax=Mesorhizobium sp. M1340 TaxID=2957087 RepID=UPI003337F65A